MKMAAPGEGAAIAWVQELSESGTLGEEDELLASFELGGERALSVADDRFTCFSFGFGKPGVRSPGFRVVPRQPAACRYNYETLKWLPAINLCILDKLLRSINHTWLTRSRNVRAHLPGVSYQFSGCQFLWFDFPIRLPGESRGLFFHLVVAEWTRLSPGRRQWVGLS